MESQSLFTGLEDSVTRCVVAVPSAAELIDAVPGGRRSIRVALFKLIPVHATALRVHRPSVRAFILVPGRRLLAIDVHGGVWGQHVARHRLSREAEGKRLGSCEKLLK